MSTLAIIDYGMGNLHSVAKAIEHVAPGLTVLVTADPQRIATAERVILPGVGAIRDCMGEIRRLGFDGLVRQVADSGRPLLGICIGMQAMMAFSEENGGVECLGLFSGKVRYFGDDLVENGHKLKVPHMGWNEVHQRGPHPLWAGIASSERFYFVHSYYVSASDPQIVSGATRYGIEFAAAIARDNIFAVQFHPEKSQQAGLQLLRNFADWNGRVVN